MAGGNGSILFIEDVNTKPFQIDRMLMQLKLAGKLESVQGIIFGEMTGCAAPEGSPYTLEDVLLRVLADFSGPIAFGLPSGHVSTQPDLTLPLGLQVKLQVNANGITLSES